MAKGKLLSKKEMQTKITELENLLKESLKLLKVRTADAAAKAVNPAPTAPASAEVGPAPAAPVHKPGETLLTKPIIPLPVPRPKPGKKPAKPTYLTGYDSKSKNRVVRMEEGANGHPGRPWWKVPGRVNADGKIVPVPRQIPIY